MKHYHLDRVIPRDHTNSIKCDYAKNPNDLPMWVADMDFPVADEIVRAAKKRAAHPIFGYSYLPDELYEAFVAWHQKRHNIVYHKEQIVVYYDVVAAIHLLLNLFTNLGDFVTIMSPVYMCFWEAIENTGRQVAVSPLVNENGYYLIDFKSLELCMQKSKVLLLCSPHNPVGRVWTPGELKKIAALAVQYDVLILSDEIHSDLLMPGFVHYPIATVDDRIKPSVITMLSCTKTFNIAQSGMAFLVSENPSYIQKIRDSLTANHLGAPNVFASVMAQAGFTYGANWLDQVIAYVWENYRLIQRILTEKMPKIILMPLEGTYLIWLDGRKLQVPIADFFENDAHVLGVDGKLFGDEGEGYYRINIAAPRKTIKKMLKKLEMAYNNLTD